MGLLKHLLFWPVTGPTALTRFALRQVEGMAQRQLTDTGPVKERLLELQLRLEMGEIDESEYEELEAEALAELREIRERREELGLSTRGGPVRFVDGDRASSTGTPSVEVEEAGEWSRDSSSDSQGPDSSSS